MQRARSDAIPPASPWGNGPPSKPSIGADNMVAPGKMRRSSKARSTRCPPIECPMTICGAGVRATQSDQKKARSLIQIAKSGMCPTAGSERRRPEPPCPRQSIAETCQPPWCHSSKHSRYFSMMSPRPPIHKMLPRDPAAGRSKIRIGQPSGNVNIDTIAPAGRTRRASGKAVIRRGYVLARPLV